MAVSYLGSAALLSFPYSLYQRPAPSVTAYAPADPSSTSLGAVSAITTRASTAATPALYQVNRLIALDGFYAGDPNTTFTLSLVGDPGAKLLLPNGTGGYADATFQGQFSQQQFNQLVYRAPNAGQSFAQPTTLTAAATLTTVDPNNKRTTVRQLAPVTVSADASAAVDSAGAAAAALPARGNPVRNLTAGASLAARVFGSGSLAIASVGNFSAAPSDGGSASRYAVAALFFISGVDPSNPATRYQVALNGDATGALQLPDGRGGYRDATNQGSFSAQEFGQLVFQAANSVTGRTLINQIAVSVTSSRSDTVSGSPLQTASAAVTITADSAAAKGNPNDVQASINQNAVNNAGPYSFGTSTALTIVPSTISTPSFYAVAQLLPANAALYGGGFGNIAYTVTLTGDASGRLVLPNGSGGFLDVTANADNLSPAQFQSLLFQAPNAATGGTGQNALAVGISVFSIDASGRQVGSPITVTGQLTTSAKINPDRIEFPTDLASFLGSGSASVSGSPLTALLGQSGQNGRGGRGPVFFASSLTPPLNSYNANASAKGAIYNKQITGLFGSAARPATPSLYASSGRNGDGQSGGANIYSRAL